MSFELMGRWHCQVSKSWEKTFGHGEDCTKPVHILPLGTVSNSLQLKWRVLKGSDLKGVWKGRLQRWNVIDNLWAKNWHCQICGLHICVSILAAVWRTWPRRSRLEWRKLFMRLLECGRWMEGLVFICQLKKINYANTI